MAPLSSDQIALVTGASRGLGYAVARELGAAGAHVIAIARTVGGLEELDDTIKKSGGSTTLVPLDLTDDPALERLGAAIHERWGRLDRWVHTAVHAPPLTPVPMIDVKDLDASLKLTARTTQRLIRVLDPLLRQAAHPSAVLFDDAPGAKFHATYAAAKAAQLAYAKAWAAESAPIALTIATPPSMPTALRARFHPGEDRSTLTDPAIVARRLMAHLAGGASSAVDLSREP
ncbi:MAG: SDR family oxidoreductase [Pseudomonadota bacterium]